METLIYLTQHDKEIDFTDFKENDILLEDLIHHLHKYPRFGGATPIGVSYSVAEHSLNLFNYFWDRGEPEYAIVGLTHDLSEAYLGDMPTPIKRLLPDYEKLERRVQRVCVDYFNTKVLNLKEEYLYRVYYPHFKYADRNIVYNEVETIMPNKLPTFLRLNKGLQKLNYCHIIFNSSYDFILSSFYEAISLIREYIKGNKHV